VPLNHYRPANLLYIPTCRAELMLHDRVQQQINFQTGQALGAHEARYTGAINFTALH
jgi:hypothetical protein